MLQPLLLLASCAALRGDAPLRQTSATFPTVVRAAVIRTDVMRADVMRTDAMRADAMPADTSARTAAFRREADRLLAAGNVRGARTTYQTAIAYLDSAGTFPGEELWALASLEYGRDHDLRAAAVLDQLAESAARYGRPEWRARALLEAGLIYQLRGRRDLSVARAQALLPLLSSPAIQQEEREAMKARISGR